MPVDSSRSPTALDFVRPSRDEPVRATDQNARSRRLPSERRWIDPSNGLRTHQVTKVGIAIPSVRGTL